MKKIYSSYLSFYSTSYSFFCCNTLINNSKTLFYIKKRNFIYHSCIRKRSKHEKTILQ